jgi:hypothetical protein
MWLSLVGMHTLYDDQTDTDQIVLALAVCFLTEERRGGEPEGD